MPVNLNPPDLSTLRPVAGVELGFAEAGIRKAGFVCLGPGFWLCSRRDEKLFHDVGRGAGMRVDVAIVHRHGERAQVGGRRAKAVALDGLNEDQGGQGYAQ